MIAHADDWIARFHAGRHEALEGLYREHFATVDRAVGGVLSGADRETVVQEVFLRLLTNDEIRRRFMGGSIAAWVATIARNQAIDFARRRGREQPLDGAEHLDAGHAELERRAEARLLVERFRQTVLPAKWQGVFETRFLEQLDQAEAATKLGIARTTLAYQEVRVRSLLRRFLLKAEDR